MQSIRLPECQFVSCTRVYAVELTLRLRFFDVSWKDRAASEKSRVRTGWQSAGNRQNDFMALTCAMCHDQQCIQVLQQTLSRTFQHRPTAENHLNQDKLGKKELHEQR